MSDSYAARVRQRAMLSTCPPACGWKRVDGVRICSVPMTKRLPILLVDDDADLGSILNQASHRGFAEATFTQVYTTAEALTFVVGLCGVGPKLILLAIYVEKRADGLDLLPLPRSQVKTRLLPVVRLMAADAPQLITTAYTDGAASFTVKPGSLADWVTYR